LTDYGRPWRTHEAFQIILKEQLKAFIRLGAKSEILVLITSAWFTSAAAGHSLAYV